MDIIYNEETKKWEEKEEPFTVLEIETEEDFNMIQKAVEQYKKQNVSGWISVEDRLPNDEDDVLILVREVEHYGMCKEKTKVYHWIFTGWHIDGAWATTYCHGHKRVEDENKEYPDCEHTVTHWMPLPELPKEKIND